jgi:hypothetical protein
MRSLGERATDKEAHCIGKQEYCVKDTKQALSSHMQPRVVASTLRLALILERSINGNSDLRTLLKGTQPSSALTALHQGSNSTVGLQLGLTTLPILRVIW